MLQAERQMAAGRAAGAASEDQHEEEEEGRGGLVSALARCTGDRATFECLRSAHQKQRGTARFDFPAFYILGWPKCATTSLY